MQDMKIRIESPTHCRYIQDALFAKGYRWNTANGTSHYEPCVNDGAWIFAYDDGVLCWDHEMDYGEGHTNEEYVYTPQKNFVKREDYYKRPETAYAQPPHDGTPALIAKQKAVADKVLKQLFPIDPFAIVAGGAPRDWHFGKPATDIDVFFYSPVDQLTIVSEMLRHVGINIDCERAGDGIPEWYKLNPNIKCVYDSVVDGVNVQIILMTGKTQDTVVPEFPFSICKAWYKHGSIQMDAEFKKCECHKIVVQTNKLYSDEHKYVQKMKNKFPDWEFFSNWEDAYKYVFEKGV